MVTPQLVPRRLFIKLTGLTGGVAYLTTRKAHAGPPKKKTLADGGRATDRLTLAGPAPAGLWSDIWSDTW